MVLAQVAIFREAVCFIRVAVLVADILRLVGLVAVQSVGQAAGQMVRLVMLRQVVVRAVVARGRLTELTAATGQTA